MEKLAGDVDKEDLLAIVTNIWQKLSSFERRVGFIVTHFWRNHTCVIKICNFTLLNKEICAE